MGANSAIEWTHHTFNPWRGCTKVSPGCAHCYAERRSGRNPKVLGTWGPSGERAIASESYWRQLKKWDDEAAAAGEQRRVFVASLADVAERDETMPVAWRPGVDAARARLWNEIQDRQNLIFLLLTKRPGHLRELLAERFPSGMLPPNLWVGASVEDQKRADERIPLLIEIPARVRFLSCEPLLGPLALSLWLDWRRPEVFRAGRSVGWVIVGGESGAKARPMHPAWARSLRDQCQAAGVAFHFKQWGEFAPWEPGRTIGVRHVSERDGRSGDHPGRVDGERGARADTAAVARIGKRAAGRLLDGREWNEFPEVRP